MTWLPGRAGNRQSAVADAQASKRSSGFLSPEICLTAANSRSCSLCQVSWVNRPCADSQAVPRIDHGDCDRQVYELLLGEDVGHRHRRHRVRVWSRCSSAIPPKPEVDAPQQQWPVPRSADIWRDARSCLGLRHPFTPHAPLAWTSVGCRLSAHLKAVAPHRPRHHKTLARPTLNAI